MKEKSNWNLTATASADKIDYYQQIFESLKGYEPRATNRDILNDDDFLEGKKRLTMCIYDAENNILGNLAATYVSEPFFFADIEYLPS